MNLSRHAAGKVPVTVGSKAAIYPQVLEHTRSLGEEQQQKKDWQITKNRYKLIVFTIFTAVLHEQKEICMLVKGQQTQRKQVKPTRTCRADQGQLGTPECPPIS